MVHSYAPGGQRNTRAESDDHMVERTARVRWIAARGSAGYSGEGLVGAGRHTQLPRKKRPRALSLTKTLVSHSMPYAEHDAYAGSRESRRGIWYGVKNYGRNGRTLS